MSAIGDLVVAVIEAAKKDKPAALAALASRNVSIESVIAAAVKANVKNPILAEAVSALLPAVEKSLPSLESQAFDFLASLAEKEAASL